MIQVIAYSYWRLIKANRKTFDKVPNTISADVKTLAKQEVLEGLITEEEYLKFIGEIYK